MLTQVLLILQEKLKNTMDQISQRFPYLEKLLSEAAIENFGFVSRLCYADILLAEYVEGCLGFISIDVFKSYPKTFSVYQKVVSLPAISSYLSSEKRYPFPKNQVAEEFKANVDTVLGRVVRPNFPRYE